MAKNKKFLLPVLLAGVAIVAIYVVLRIFNLTNLPIFTDEAIYIRWAQIAKQDATWRFISLTDGKQPMFIWWGMITLKLFADPLFAGRMVSVIAGLGTVVGLFFLGNEVFREKSEKIFSFTKKSVSIGLLSSAIYVIYPFALVYDRMALYDTMVGMFAVWSLYLLILLVRTLRLDVALISGLVIGGGLLTKTNAFFSLGSIPFLLLLFPFKQKELKSRFLRFIGLCAVVSILSLGLYSILRLSPFYHIIADKNALFVYPLNEWIKHPFTYFGSNLSALVNWFLIYVNVPILLILASFMINKRNLPEKILLVLWFLFPFTYLAFFGKLIYPRFILFMTLPLIPLISYSVIEIFERYKNVLVRGAVVVVAFAFYIYCDFFILTDFVHAPIPRADSGQFVNSWSAGNGVAQSVDYFKQQAEKGKIYIATEGTFGLMPFGLEMYLVDNPNVTIKAYWPINETPQKEITDAAGKMPTYAIFYQPCPSCGPNGGKTPTLWHSKLIATYRQGNSQDYYSIYRILP